MTERLKVTEMLEAAKADQARIKREMEETMAAATPASRSPANVLQAADNLDANGWEVAKAALRSRDTYKARWAEAIEREQHLRKDLDALRDTVGRLQSSLDDEKAVTEALTKTLKKLARKESA